MILFALVFKFWDVMVFIWILGEIFQVCIMNFWFC